MRKDFYELVPRLLIDFKLSIVEEEMKHTLQALANPDIYNNPEKCQEIMQHYKELQKNSDSNGTKKQATASFYVSYFPSPLTIKGEIVFFILIFCTNQVHELFARLGLIECACKVRGRRYRILLFHSSHLHTHVFGFYYHHYA